MADTERQSIKSSPCGKTHGHCSVAEEYGICVEAVIGCCPFYNLKHWEIENEAKRLVKKYFPSFDYGKDRVTNEMLSKIVRGEEGIEWNG